MNFKSCWSGKAVECRVIDFDLISCPEPVDIAHLVGLLQGLLKKANKINKRDAEDSADLDVIRAGQGGALQIRNS